MMKNPPANVGDTGLIPGGGRFREGNATHSSILACEIPWRSLMVYIQCMGSQKIGHNSATDHHHKMLP